MSFKRIKEYISTGDGTEGTLLIPKLIMPVMIQETEKRLLPREMAAFVRTGFEGSSFSVNLEEHDTLDLRKVGEGGEIPLDGVGHEYVTFTPVKYGVAIRITREMREDSQFDLFADNLRIVGKRFAENENKLVLTALDQANTTVAGGAQITVANITTAMQEVEDNDFEPTDMPVGNEVLNDLRNIDLFTDFGKSGDREMLERGFRGVIYGMMVSRFTSSTKAVPSADSKKHAYVFDRSKAYGIGIKRNITVENFTLPTYDMDGAAVTQRIDVKPLRKKAIAKITTT